jgi:hypothetical protein
MNITNKVLKRFNTRTTIGLVASFPQQGKELAAKNAVAWYTHQLITHFPKSQKIVVFADVDNSDQTPWLLQKNILVVPTFSGRSSKFLTEIISSVSKFDQVSKIVIQFEFNSFASKLNAGQIAALIPTLKIKQKYVTLAIHQVIDDINEMAGHIGLKQNSLKAKIINQGLHNLYRTMGVFVDSVIVFDQELKRRLSKYTNQNKISVIPIGVETVSSSTTSVAAARKHLKLPKNAFVITAFGYQSWYKGTDWIANQAGKLAKKYPKHQIHLLIAGGKSPTVENKQFENNLRRATKQYSKSITVLGYVPENDLATCFKASDLIVYPYRAMMAASGALTHALAHQKPFIISAPLTPSLTNEDIGVSLLNNALNKEQLTFQLNTKSFEERVMAIIENSRLRTKLGKFSKELKLKRSWDRVGKQYLSLVNNKPSLLKTTGTKSQKPAKLPEISVFFPLYNEQENVKPLVQHALKALPKIADKFEVILVNDGSQDNTAKLADQMSKRYRQVRVIHQKNGGYGRALRTGFEQAKYDWVFFTDGDLQFDLNEISLMLPFAQSYDSVIGFRKNRADSPKRLLLAKMLKVWNKFLFGFPKEIIDIDCAFKLFHRRTVASIFPLKSYGAIISTEMLLKVIDQKFSIKQLGVTHYPRQFGTPTGADPHVIFGAIKESFKLVVRRYLSQSQHSLHSFLRYQFTSMLLILFSSISAAR